MAGLRAVWAWDSAVWPILFWAGTYWRDAIRTPADLIVRCGANCDLHFDHCGGNLVLAGRQVFTQRFDLETAQSSDHYTVPELADTPGGELRAGRR
jgi:hypothetical protein